MLRKGSLTGLLLFGIFFGAGNLIFPPTLGALSGNQFWPAIAGFVLSGVGIAIVTLIIGTLNPKGYIDEISRKISPVFAIVYLVALYLSIGPFFAIPRTATVSFEVGIAPLLGGMNASLALFIFTLVYFLLAFLIALNPSKILDRIGRILTPIFCDSHFDFGRSWSFKIQWTRSNGSHKSLSGFCLWARIFRGVQYLGCLGICCL